MGIRSPDNLGWAEDGFIDIQEDNTKKQSPLLGSHSGQEASLWRLDPLTGEVQQIAQIDPCVAELGRAAASGRDRYGAGYGWCRGGRAVPLDMSKNGTDCRAPEDESSAICESVFRQPPCGLRGPIMPREHDQHDDERRTTVGSSHGVPHEISSCVGAHGFSSRCRCLRTGLLSLSSTAQGRPARHALPKVPGWGW